jgi:membrane associated rhomboid family serine protease
VTLVFVRVTYDPAAHVGGFIFGAVAARLFAGRGSDPKLEWAR